MNTKNISIIILIFSLGFMAGGVVLFVLINFPKNSNTDGIIACTAEAKLCPDGSAVGRTGPNCEFSPCPSDTPEPIYNGGGSSGSSGGSAGGGVVYPDGGAVACTEEAKLCSDGSAVGRTGPNCEFSPCPPTSGHGAKCQSDQDCPAGMSCVDFAQIPIGREGVTPDFRCWNNSSPMPICLSGDTLISTPNGEVVVTDIKEGMSVWSVNSSGEKFESVIILVGKTLAPFGHKIMHIQLSDGRELFVSPKHQVADGREASQIMVGDVFQSAVVIVSEPVPYTGTYTYDILPASETGMYFANGILLQSTLVNHL